MLPEVHTISNAIAQLSNALGVSSQMVFTALSNAGSRRGRQSQMRLVGVCVLRHGLRRDWRRWPTLASWPPVTVVVRTNSTGRKSNTRRLRSGRKAAGRKTAIGKTTEVTFSLHIGIRFPLPLEVCSLISTASWAYLPSRAEFPSISVGSHRNPALVGNVLSAPSLHSDRADMPC